MRVHLSETAFVFSARQGGDRCVRIFTPRIEVPFAGHPNIGTAFVLASTGELGEIPGTLSVVFEERAGLVSIAIRREPGKLIWCELAAPQPLTVGKDVSPALLASAVSLRAGDLLTSTHAPQVACVGLSFLFAEVIDRDALQRARTDPHGIDGLIAAGAPQDVHLYLRSADEFDVRCRMFAPVDGVPEDPATGSADCALAGLLAHHDPGDGGAFRWRIAQGVELGRPSAPEARAEKRGGEDVSTWIAGTSALVSEGFIDVD